MLQVKKLTKTYGRGSVAVKALDSVSIDFPDKGMVVILGKSGCGKSTLLNMLGGLDRPTKGDVLIDGKRLNSLSAAKLNDYRNTYIGFVFQNFNIIDNKSVYDNIELALKLQNNEQDVTFIDDVLTNVGLGGLGYRKPSELSGGQRQRVAIARALIKNPEIILADEPTGAVDSGTGDDLFVLLKKLSKTKLVIVVTHDDETAYRYGDRIISLEDGRIKSDVDRIRRSDDAETQMLADNIMFVKAGHRFSDDDAKKIINRKKDNYLTFEQDRQHVILAYPETLDVIDTGYKPGDFGEHSEPAETVQRKFSLRRARMGLGNCFAEAFSNIKKRRKKLTTMILISIGCMVFFYIAAALVNISAETIVAESAEKFKVDFFSVANEFTYGEKGFDAEAAEQAFGAQQTGRAYKLPISYFAQNDTKLEADDGESYYYEPKKAVSGIVVVSDFPQFGLNLIHGEYPEAVDGVVVSDWLAGVLCSTGYISYSEQGEFLFRPKDEAEIVGSTIVVANGDLTSHLTITGVFETNSAYIKSLSKDDDRKEQYFEDSRSSFYSYIYGRTGLYEFCLENVISKPESAEIRFDKEDTSKEFFSVYFYGCKFSKYTSLAKDDVFTAVKGFNRTAALRDNNIVISYDIAVELFYNLYEWKDNITAKDLAKILGRYDIDLGSGGYIVYEEGKDGADSEDSAEDENRRITVNIVAVSTDYSYTVHANAELLKTLARMVYICDRLVIPAAGRDITMLSATAKESEFELNNALFSNVNSMIEDFKRTSNVLFIISAGIAFFVFITILNFLLIMVKERQKENGIMRAMGASNRVTMGVFFVELWFVILTVIAFSSAISALILRAVNSSLYYVTSLSIVFVRLGWLEFLFGFAAFTLFVFICAAPILLKQAARQPIRIINDI